MRIASWHTLVLDDGVLREATGDDSRMVLWLPTNVGHWERIGNVPRADIDSDGDLCATAATLIQVRQATQGLLGRFAQLFRKQSDGPTWLLPNGKSAEQSSERQTDILLV